MLISHRYKFILLKTEKTASSSLLTVFRKIINDHDELYPANRITKKLLLRQHGSLNNFSFDSHGNKFSLGRGKWGLKFAKPGGLKRTSPRLFGLHSHAKAKDIREFIGDEIFDSYTKIISERNPWDRQVSLFKHRCNKNKKINIAEFNNYMCSSVYNTIHYNRLHNWDIYSIDDEVCADYVIRFEHLNSDFNAVLDSMGIDRERYQLPHYRNKHHKNTSVYRDLYSDKSRELIRKWYRKEIEYFGYEF